jgi:ribonuclease P protein component
MGFTATKKLGNAVVRNRAKRRMREIARLEFGANREGFDIVMVAREGITIAPFATLRQAFRDALARLDVPC